jgi:hypothetical protein
MYWSNAPSHRTVEDRKRELAIQTRRITMAKSTNLAGPFPLPNTALTVHRMGYGAMQLAGPQVWGPPRDVNAAVAVLREAVASGVNHIDTATTTARTSPIN